MPVPRCPVCGASLSQESLDVCSCPARTPARSGGGVDGRSFVRFILLIAAALALLSVALFYGIVHLRMSHGLSGLHG